jgi:hypothetical protein
MPAMNRLPTSLTHVLRLLTVPAVLAGLACGEPTAPASDLAGTWDYRDSLHAEVSVLPGGRPYEFYVLRTGRVRLSPTQQAAGGGTQYEGQGDMLVRAGDRPLDGSRGWLVTTYDPSLQPFLVTSLEEGVRGLIVGGPETVPWTAVARQSIAYELGSDAYLCTGVMPPRGDATACEIHIVWRRVGS